MAELFFSPKRQGSTKFNFDLKGFGLDHSDTPGSNTLLLKTQSQRDSKAVGHSRSSLTSSKPTLAQNSGVKKDCQTSIPQFDSIQEEAGALPLTSVGLISVRKQKKAKPEVKDDASSPEPTTPFFSNNPTSFS